MKRGHPRRASSTKEDVEVLINWARSCQIWLNPGHEALAHEHGVSTEGVLITRPLPMRRGAKIYTTVG